MKKISNILVLFLVFSFSAVAEDRPYLGLKYQQLKVDHITVDGYDLNNFAPDKFKLMDVHIGYNFSNNLFVELGYLKSDDPSKSGTQTVGGITITGTNVKLEVDGFRIGTGYNYKATDKLLIKPFVNYYDLDIKGSGTLTASAGAATATAGLSGTDSDNMIDAGVNLAFIINENSQLGLSYSRAIDKLDDTDKNEILSANISYQF